MNAPDTPLFRKEVIDHRANRLNGDISLAVPMSWHVIGYTMWPRSSAPSSSWRRRAIRASRR